jgi:hypothetical protein
LNLKFLCQKEEMRMRVGLMGRMEMLETVNYWEGQKTFVDVIDHGQLKHVQIHLEELVQVRELKRWKRVD